MNNDKIVRDYLLYLLHFNSLEDLSVEDSINVGLFICICNKLIKK